jgi:vacuolar protein sorting-associated protein 13D
MQPFEVEFKQLNVRLSYNDLKLFLAIAQSLPPLTSSPSAPPTPSGNKVNNALVKQMLPLGYTKSEIRHQLFLNSNNHSSSEGDPAVREEGVEEGQGTGGKVEEVDTATGMKFTVGKIELSIRSVSVCLIDDSANRDVPLLELSFSHVQGVHDPWRRRGEAKAIVAGDYYNRHISAWEPVLEPWKLRLIWEKIAQYSTDLDSREAQDRMCLRLISSERLCVNITSSLIQLLNVTQSSWRQDLRRRLREEGGGTQLEDVRIKSHRRTGSGRSHDQSHDPMMSSQMERGLALLHSVRLVSETRQRSKFIPFLLRNSTGLCLQFATLTSVPSQVRDEREGRGSSFPTETTMVVTDFSTMSNPQQCDVF